MKKLVILLVLVASVGLNAKNLSDEEFVKLFNDCLDNKNKVSCQKLIDGKYLKSVEQCGENSCTDIGFVYGVTENYQQANLYSKKGCDTFNEPESCFNLGLRYHNGQGVRQDFAKARHYLEKGCKLNYGFACNNLGVLYREGKGVRQNYSTAKKYYGKACDLGNQMGCDNYKMLNEAGIQ